MAGLNLTPEERQARKANWAQKQREYRAEAAKHKAKTDGLFGVNGVLSRGVSSAADAAGTGAIGQGVINSLPFRLMRASVMVPATLAKGGWNETYKYLSGAYDKPFLEFSRNAYDPVLRRQTLKALPESVKDATGKVLGYRDGAYEVAGELLGDAALFKGLWVPGKAPAEHLAKAVQGRNAAELAKAGLSGSLDFAFGPSYITRIGKKLVGQDTHEWADAENYQALDDARENALKRVLHDPKLTPKQKDDKLRRLTGAYSGNDEDIIRLYDEEIKKQQAQKQQAENPAEEPAPKPKDKSILDYLNEYKGEIGFGALGGAAGYGLGHAFKWGMPAKLLSTIAGAALGAYGYNRLKR